MDYRGFEAELLEERVENEENSEKTPGHSTQIKYLRACEAS